MFAGLAAMFGLPKDCACGASAIHLAWDNGQRVMRCAACHAEAEKAKMAADRNALMDEYASAFAAVAAHNREALTCVLGSSADAEAWRKRAAEVAARAHRAKAALERAGMMPR